MNTKNIYLIFSKTGTLLSQAISACTHKEYAHVSISLDSTFRKMYSFGRVIPNLPYPGGFVEENLYSGVYELFPESKCMIYKLEITEDQFNIIKESIEEFLSRKDVYKYNLLGSVTLLFNKPLEREDMYFCSQFVSELLIKCGLLDNRIDPRLVRPLDLLQFENKKLVYEGVIKDSYLYNLYKDYSIAPTSDFQFTSFIYSKVKNIF